MCRLFESIKVVDGRLLNIDYHNSRLNRSRRELFNCTDEVDLRDVIEIPPDLPRAVYKCRVEYAAGIERVEFTQYQRRIINTLTLVECDTIEYAHKYVDRGGIHQLLEGIVTDDILIVKHGLITDTSFANIVFHDGARWLTPATPLLKGTARARLLNQHTVIAEEIRVSDLRRFTKAAIINAMLDLEDERTIPIKAITPCS
jgi:4-amino-4-deoxychorismate lyase